MYPVTNPETGDILQPGRINITVRRYANPPDVRHSLPSVNHGTGLIDLNPNLRTKGISSRPLRIEGETLDILS
ncbi:MAG: hypothetical protein QGG39_16180, partial [Candidatus Poribacteria bacterium]|nr:hypothetical protein [Candidatus Poribacteria bacterium]